MDDLSYISEPTQIAGIAEMSKGLNFGMPSEALLGCLLKTLVASKPEGRFLELGTGTGIATGKDLGVIDMRQIAPTLAQILGASLKTANQPILSLQQ